jgi:hypothetical protein
MNVPRPDRISAREWQLHAGKMNRQLLRGAALTVAAPNPTSDPLKDGSDYAR